MCVGAAGFEPATPWSQTRCANRTALRPEYILTFLFNCKQHFCCFMRPSRPERDALTGLRYASNFIYYFTLSIFHNSFVAFTLRRSCSKRDTLTRLRCILKLCICPTKWRWRGDSNPRYRFQYDSLANCWFKPLTHPTVDNFILKYL